MPFKDPEKKKEHAKRYRVLNAKEIDKKQTKKRQEFLNSLEGDAKEQEIKKRRGVVLKSYYKNRDKTLAKNRENGFKKALKYLYSITYEQYLELLDKQNSKCAICGCNPFEKRWTSKKLPFAVDHCHDTKKIRGLLCDNCNVMLGHAMNDKNILINSIKYLEKNGQ